MPRQRPVAGRRNRPRLDPAVVPARRRLADRPVRQPGERATGGPDTRSDAVPAAVPTATAAAGQATGTRPRDVLVLAAAVLALMLVLTAGVLVLRTRAADRVERARSQAVGAAEAAAADLLSYDYRRLDRDFARARRNLTGGFAKDYARTTERVVRPTAVQVKAVVRADVVASSVVAAQQNRVVVLLFVNQTTTSTRVEGPKVDLNRVRMTMLRVGADWKVSAVTAL